MAMLNHDAIENAITSRIGRMESDVVRNGRLSAVFLALSTAPFVALCWVAFTQVNGGWRQEVSFSVLVIAAIGLTIVIWNIGGTFRYEQRRAAVERDRLENLRLSFLAVPAERMQPKDILATINQLSGDLWPFVRTRHSHQVGQDLEGDDGARLVDYD